MSSATIEVLAAVAIPILAFGLNWAIRDAAGYVMSSASDFMLAIMGFDVAAIAAQDTFSHVVRYAAFREAFAALFICLFVITFFAWRLGSLPLERAIQAHYDASPRIRNFLLVASWALALAATGPQIFSFLYVG